MFSGASKKNKGGKTPQAKKPVRVPTATYLENAALYYVQRYAATTVSLRRVLQRRVQKAQRAYAEFDAAPCAAWIDAVIQKFVRLGYINDATFAEQKITSMRQKGASAKAISAALRTKGVASTIETDDATELQAARRYIKRKRLGIHRTRRAENATQKDLGALARAGFSRGIAMKALQEEAKNE